MDNGVVGPALAHDGAAAQRGGALADRTGPERGRRRAAVGVADVDTQQAAAAAQRHRRPPRARVAAHVADAFAHDLQHFRAEPVAERDAAVDVEVDLDPAADGGRTRVPELTGEKAAGLLLLNEGDLTYAKIRLDGDSVAAVPSILPLLDDSLARAVIWAAMLDAVVDGFIAQLLNNGPGALGEIKHLFHRLEVGAVGAETRQLTAETIARVRARDEAREGFAAFLAKRPAAWITG